MNDWIWLIIEILIKALGLFTMILLVFGAFNTWVERRVSAWTQMRIGPNRVGPFGLLQPFADVLKLFLKEDIVPDAANKFIHKISPVITLGVTISIYAVIPVAGSFQIGDRIIHLGLAPDINVAILYILAMTSVSVYGFTLGGWASNNKYSLLGALRSSAQMISYELSMGLALVALIMVTQTFSLNKIVIAQENWNWFIFYQPLGFILFLISAFAETNRTPFDLPEAEPELVGGYNTEYSGMKFGMYYLAEYANMGTSSAIMVLLYFGGWTLPFPASWLGLQEGSVFLALIQFLTFIIKTELMVFFFVWVRWTIPRFRYDQLMNLGWKVLLPLSILNVALTGIFLLIFGK
jgi:NADH-quinone oxidoreductase subunit H